MSAQDDVGAPSGYADTPAKQHKMPRRAEKRIPVCMVGSSGYKRSEKLQESVQNRNGEQ